MPIQTLKSSTYIRVVNLPYSNHQIAKEMLNQVLAEVHAQPRDNKKQAVVQIPLSKFTTSGKRTIRGLFIYTATQMEGYCPADEISIKLGKRMVKLTYVQHQQYYKGIEEL